MVSWVDILNQKEEIQQKVYHHFLNQKLGDLEIDVHQVGVLSVFLEKIGIPLQKRELYLTPIVLVKTALDIHEDVNKKNVRSTQMIILAGDLYSGYYYQLLSNINEVGLVGEIAKAIKNINRYKIEVLREYSNKGELPFHFLWKIETALLEGLENYFHAEGEKDLAGKLLYLNRLISEYRLEFTGATIFQACYTEEKASDYYYQLKKEIMKNIAEIDQYEIESLGYKLIYKAIKKQMMA